MKKALFAVVLVAASFAGGAAINGPGLAWARTLLRPKPVALGPLLPPPPNDPPPRAEGSDATGADDPDAPPAIPAAPRPPLTVDLPSKGTKPAVTKPVAKPSAPPERLDPKAVAEGTTTLEGPAPTPGDDDPALDPPAIRPVADAGDAKDAHDDPAVGRAVVDRVNPPELKPAAATAAGSDWPALRRRMAELGVSRYWVEGEPGGACRFRCVIPVAGERAVGQQFEAEGDDVLRAAEAALKRVALWKATEAG